MTQVSLTLNGNKVKNEVEPRTSLADFVRDHHDLTGTNLGCEQGVCGACTMIVDGIPVRSCLVRVATCGGTHVQTIESFDDDEIMIQLRAAFSTHHALQCGYCTPGMLATARDIVMRLPDADTNQIRLELSGNLCRCTGYTGIIHAISSVLKSRKENIFAPNTAI